MNVLSVCVSHCWPKMTGSASSTVAWNLLPGREIYIYRVYKEKLHRFEIALKFAKQLLVSSSF